MLHRPRPTAVAIPLLALGLVACSADAPDAAPDVSEPGTGSSTPQGPPVYRISQQAVTTQHLADATVTVEYSRPMARGRSPIFGNVVHYGEVWTPGANEATVLELSEETTIEGTPVPAGRWSVWLIPSQVGAWELVLEPTDALFHTMPPEVGGEGQVRIEVPHEATSHVEVLTWDFPEVDRNRGTLRLAWGETAVPLDVEVSSNLPETVVSAEEAARYEGTWQMAFEPPPGMEVPDGVPLSFPIPIHRGENGHLRADLPPETMPGGGPAEEPDASASALERERFEGRQAAREQLVEGPFYIALVPFAEGIFRMAFVQTDGTVMDVENIFFEFEFDEEGVANALAMRNEADQIMGRAERAGG